MSPVCHDRVHCPPSPLLFTFYCTQSRLDSLLCHNSRAASDALHWLILLHNVRNPILVILSVIGWQTKRSYFMSKATYSLGTAERVLTRASLKVNLSLKFKVYDRQTGIDTHQLFLNDERNTKSSNDIVFRIWCWQLPVGVERERICCVIKEYCPNPCKPLLCLYLVLCCR